jgi:hypothetical protein
MAVTRAFALFLLLCSWLIPTFATAQSRTISGRIVDAETLDPLPFAHVFIDQTTLGSVSDVNGEYVIEDLRDGSYRLVFSYVGYELFYQTITVNGADVRLSARLVPQLEMLQAIEVKGSKDKEWEAKLKQFNRVFFGETEWARDCKILNPWALDFKYDAVERKNIALASEALQIENNALGYTIICNLQLFSYDKQSYKIRGLYKFEEANTKDPKQAQRWTRNRKQAYQNSLRFLMKSLVDNHESANGFNVYIDKRPAKYTSESGYFTHELERNLEPMQSKNMIAPAGYGLYKLTVDRRLEIHHTTQYARQKTYRDVAHPVSWIETEKGFVLITDEGHIQNNDQVITSGELNGYRTAGMLPLNYSPGSFVVVNYLTKRNQAKRLQERIYVQTDKATYYAGEPIWFKAHLNYANPSLRDSLSRVVYVELLLGSDSVLTSCTLKADTLGAAGMITLPANAPQGTYLLRAYTRWMQNYGPDMISYTPIRVLPNNIKFAAAPELLLQNSNDFKFTPGPWRPDTLTYWIDLDSTLFKDWATCAVSVAPYANGHTNHLHELKNSLSFYEDLPDGTLGDFVFPLEYNFAMHGKAIHAKRKQAQASMTIIQGKLDSLYTLKTNRSGYFKLEGLDFYDTLTFSFQARDKKGRPFKRTQLIAQARPPMPKSKLVRFLKIDTVHVNGAIQLTQPKNDSVIVKTNNLKERTTYQGFSTADYLLTEADLENMPRGQSIVMALQGRIPGLQYNSTTRMLSFRGGGASSQGSSEPLFVVDGMPISMGQQQNNRQQTQQVVDVQQQAPVSSDNAQQQLQQSNTRQPTSGASQEQDLSSLGVASSATDMLSHITVENVARIEISSRMDPRYGSMAANGVIAIYTKKDQVRTSPEAASVIDRYVVQGYQKPVQFIIPTNYHDQGDHAYQPTVYWNPTVVVHPEAGIQIQIPMASVHEVYRISVGGVTKNGVPVFGEFLFDSGKPKPVNASLDLHQK